MTDISLFDYHLPEERIAQKPVEPRDQAKLLFLDRKTGTMQDAHIYDLPDFLQPGDLLVMNKSKVFKARLSARIKNKELSFENTNKDISEMLRVVAANRALPKTERPEFKPEKTDINSLREEIAV